jgi:hypothetical protein
MKHKQLQTKSYRSFIVLVAILAIVSVTIVTVLVLRNSTEAEAPSQAKQKTIKSVFSFDAAKAPGWRQGPTNTTSMAIFANNMDCWVSLDTKVGTVNEQVELQKSFTMLTSDGYTLEQKETLPLTLPTTSGAKPYNLYQYVVSGNGAGGELYAGHQVGYIQFPQKYALIHVYCKTVDQLPTAMPVLQAITFDDSK